MFLAGAARGEGPLVQRINELCGIRPGTPRADAGTPPP
jgi:hypothetical protein